ncbi:hypothetical protein SASPL_142663 [Salvia splendens]|uniref:Uncharacterized protein n=1 Tax=Salvia splendens TaxID=180675 RepID=A0A8X8Z9P0_SALSN|nr:hypothetical protein SASPL_142663 [Salvia splendens]
MFHASRQQQIDSMARSQNSGSGERRRKAGCDCLTGYTVISYNSAEFSSAMLNLIPGFTFMLAVVFRLLIMPNVVLKSISGFSFMRRK